MSKAEAGGVTAVVVPFPAHGHLNQLLNFSILLSTRPGLAVHFASSATHNRQAKLRLQGWPPSSLSSIHFHDFPLPPIPSPPPNPSSHTTFPFHLQPLFEASDLLRSPISSLLRSLSTSSRRLIVVHDPLMSFAGLDAAAIPNAESYVFNCISTAFLCEVELLMMPETSIVTELTTPDFQNLMERRFKDMITISGHIINTSRAAEGEFLDLLARKEAYSGKPIFAVGPLNPAQHKANNPRNECLEWLDKQPPCSVVYISFGTMSTISDEQAEQLAAGLRSSGHRFLWVLRDADRADIFASESSSRRLPAGFEKVVEGFGKVVRSWAPQLDVLAHRATGGFMSHCGWNSCMEAVSCGVPVMAWPMHSDQPVNAKLVAEVLRVGVVVRGWDRRRDVVTAERVEEVVRMVMEGEEGGRMRKRATEICGAVRAAAKDGGSSKLALDALVACWTR